MADTAPVAADISKPASKDISSGALFWIAVSGLFLFVAEVLAPHLKAHFVADDYVFLVEDADRPWYFSGDFLYRPFRNLLAHILPRLIGLAPTGYRLLVIGVVLATLGLFFVLLRQFGLSKQGSVVGVLIAAFYPRHAVVYYFWAASQDAFMALLLIGSFVFWIDYRSRHRNLSYWLALACFALGLGFKEPAGCFPALVLGWDVFRLGRRWRQALQPAFWRPYLGFALVLSAYGAFVLWYPQGRFHQPPDRYATYGFFGLARFGFAWIRTWINLLLPFSGQMSLHDVRTIHVLILGAIGAALLGLLMWLRLGSAIAVCALAIALVNVPTSLFASTNAGDQYLYLPSFILAGLSGHVAGTVLEKKSWPTTIVTLALLTSYVLAGTIDLRQKQMQWQHAGELSTRIIDLVRTAVAPAGLRELTLIGPPQNYQEATVYNNGMLGALLAAGYPRGLHVFLTHIDSLPRGSGQRFMERSLVCEIPVGKAGPKRVLVVTADRLAELDPACAEPILTEDQETRSSAWSTYPDH